MFQAKGKLAPRYVGPYPIIDIVEPAAYHLQLPESMSDIYNVFHVSQLQKCLKCQIATSRKSQSRFRKIYSTEKTSEDSSLSCSKDQELRIKAL